uniref:phospholipase D n=1 Tax=Streptomyces sp. NBC_00003 TaxID=2903608 RepID=A0AAU2VFD2_9ACTN
MRRPKALLLSLAAALFTFALAPASASAATEAEAAAVTTGAIFNNPAGTTAEQDRIRDHLLGLVNQAPAGSTITAGLYTFTDNSVGEALVAAKTRGVNVRIAIDHKSSTMLGGETGRLTDALGTDTTKPSYVVSCPAGRGCIGNRVLHSGDDGSINHNKFWLFSSVGGSSNVVVQTSANLTNPQRLQLFNNAVTVADKGLYDIYQAYFADLVSGAKGAGTSNYYTSAVSSTNSGLKAYFFPRKEAAGTAYNNDPSTDTVKQILDNADCSSGTTVRMAANLFSRVAVASKLVSMVAAGCKVYLAADANPGDADTPRSMSQDVEDILYGKLTQRVECWENPPTGTDKIGIHSKYLMIEGTYDGKASQKLVWTGSHNYSYAALRSNDETLLKINDAAIYGQFKADHDHLMSYCAGS